MDKFLAKKYYERPEIQRALTSFAKHREIGTRFDGYFGKRPEMIEYVSDVRVFAKQGIFSFHMSEERWANPMLIGNDKLSDVEKNKNKVGWDLILDLDGKDIVYAKMVGKLIVDFLTGLGVKNVSTKFSGNKGFHIGVPFEAFSEQIIGVGETRLLFPEAARRISSYLIVELRQKIAKAILDHDKSIEKLAKKYDMKVEELTIDDPQTYNLDYMKIIEIDTLLISSRHLFRMPYSLNEKSGLVSIPIRNDSIMDFERFLAKPEKVDPKKYEQFEFLAYKEEFGKDADILLIKAYEDDYAEQISKELSSKRSSDTEFTFDFEEQLDIKDFPQTIQHVLSSDFEDGRKRALFLLLTFMNAIKWDKKHIEEIVDNWNDKLSTPLKKNYIKAQYAWFKAQHKTISPPNYDNANYYESIGMTKEIIEKDKKKFRNRIVKNPLHYAILFQTAKQKTPRKKK